MTIRLPAIAQTLANLDLAEHDDLVSICNNHKNTKDILSEVFSRDLISSQKLCKELSQRFAELLAAN